MISGAYEPLDYEIFTPIHVMGTFSGQHSDYYSPI